MLTPVAPSTSNINDRLQCRRHLKAEEVMRLIADIYDRPVWTFVIRRTGQDNVDVLRIQRGPPGLGICESALLGPLRKLENGRQLGLGRPLDNERSVQVE